MSFRYRTLREKTCGVFVVGMMYYATLLRRLTIVARHLIIRAEQ